MDVSTRPCRFVNVLLGRSDSTDGSQWSDEYWKLQGLYTKLHKVLDNENCKQYICLFWAGTSES